MGIAVVAAAMSLNLVLGQTGQFSLGHAGFIAIGAYVSAAVTFYFPACGTTQSSSTKLSLDMAVFSGGEAEAGASGRRRSRDCWSASRRSASAAIIWPSPRWVSAKSSASSCSTSTPSAAHAALPASPSAPASLPCSSAVALVRLGDKRLDGLPAHGRAALAVREDEIAAVASWHRHDSLQDLGFRRLEFLRRSSRRALFAHHQGYLNPQLVPVFTKSIEIVVMVVVGGLGNTSHRRGVARPSC